MQSSSLLHPSSFYPIFKTTISLPDPDYSNNCSLHLHYALPPIVFIDPYELRARADSYFFQYSPAGPLGGNLELPVPALDSDVDDDAGLLLTLSTRDVDVEVPLHIRYGAIASGTGNSRAPPYQLTQFPWPDAFLACPANSTATSSDALNLPPMLREFIETFFDGEKTRIVRLKPAPDALLVETFRTPVGHAADVGCVELGTAVVILAAFFYLVWAARRTAERLNRVVKEE